MRRHRQSAFTLIELLVVIGVIALMAGALLFGLSGGNSSVSLGTAQSSLAGLLSAARSQAAIEGRDVAIMINADLNDRENYLHTMVLVGAKGGEWEQIGDMISLPNNIYVVPPSSVPTQQGVYFAKAVSSALAVGNKLEGVPQLSLRFTSLGKPDGTNGAIVFSTADRQPESVLSPILFNNAEDVRGVIISAYGAVTFVDEKNGF